MWIRVKAHQERLKKVLVREAKKDLYERLVAEQAELDQMNQRRAHFMYEWEDRKNITEHLKKQEQRRKKERENLNKIQKQEQAY